MVSIFRSSDQPQQAEPFLLDCLQLFANDQWTSLEVDTWVQLAVCEQAIGNYAAYIRACLKVASHSRASQQLREEFMKRITDFTADGMEFKHCTTYDILSNFVTFTVFKDLTKSGYITKNKK